MNLNNDLMPFFVDFLTESYGCRELTSERERELGRRRFFDGDYLLVITVGRPYSELFNIIVIPVEDEQRVIDSWKQYVQVIAQKAKE